MAKPFCEIMETWIGYFDAYTRVRRYRNCIAMYQSVMTFS